MRHSASLVAYVHALVDRHQEMFADAYYPFLHSHRSCDRRLCMTPIRVTRADLPLLRWKTQRQLMRQSQA